MEWLKRLLQTRPTQHDLDANVAQTVALMIAHPDAEDAFLIEALEAKGIPTRMAWDLILFVPSAFTRVIVAHLSIRFSDEYTVIHPTNDSKKTRRYADQPVFVAARRYAEQLKGHATSEMFLAVGGRDADFKAINQALNDGANPQDLIIYTTVTGT